MHSIVFAGDGLVIELAAKGANVLGFVMFAALGAGIAIRVPGGADGFATRDGDEPAALVRRSAQNSFIARMFFGPR